jgi:hypothetical protein
MIIRLVNSEKLHLSSIRGADINIKALYFDSMTLFLCLSLIVNLTNNKSIEKLPDMAKEKKVTAGEKTAKVTGLYSTRNQVIAGVFLLLGVFLTWFLSKKNPVGSEARMQNIRDQKVDSGTIQNYNASGDMKIENNTYNGVAETMDSTNKNDKRADEKTIPLSNQKKNVQVNVTSNNQSGGQTANQINNNN